MLLKLIKEDLIKCNYIVFMDWKTQYSKDVSSPQTDL